MEKRQVETSNAENSSRTADAHILHRGNEVVGDAGCSDEWPQRLEDLQVDEKVGRRMTTLVRLEGV